MHFEPSLLLNWQLLFCRDSVPVETLPSQVNAEMVNATDDNKNYVDAGGNVLPSKLEVSP